MTLLVPKKPPDASVANVSPLLTTRLLGQKYVYGTFDIGSASIGPKTRSGKQVSGGPIHTGWFRQDGFRDPRSKEATNSPQEFSLYWGLNVRDTDKAPHFISPAGGTTVRAYGMRRAARTLMILPAEVRALIWSFCCLPNGAEHARNAEVYHNIDPRLTATKVSTSTALNLQLTCRLIYTEVSAVSYRQHAFYFSSAATLAHFTACLAQAPLINRTRTLGALVLDFGPSVKSKDVCTKKAVMHDFDMTNLAASSLAHDVDVCIEDRGGDRERAEAVESLLRQHRIMVLGVACWSGEASELWAKEGQIWKALERVRRRQEGICVVQGWNVYRRDLAAVREALGLKGMFSKLVDWKGKGTSADPIEVDRV